MLEPQPRAPGPAGEPDFFRDQVLIDTEPGGRCPVVTLSCQHVVTLITESLPEVMSNCKQRRYCSQCLNEWIVEQQA